MGFSKYTKGDALYMLPGDVAVFSGEPKISDQLLQLLDVATKHSARAAIYELDPDPKYLLDPERRRYLELAEFAPSDIALEIGASKGQHTRYIAKECAHVEALEVVPGQAAFAQLFCQQEGHSNVNVSCGGVDGILPYKNGSFDVVIMNYVLEWCAGRSGRHPYAFHRDYLQECNRVLKPGGRLVIATKNRFSITIVTGGHDEHLDMPFGSALPRPVGEHFRKQKANDQLLGYLHSRASFEALLCEAGFQNLRPFIALPDARYTKFLDHFGPSELQNIRKEYRTIPKRKLISIYLNLPFFLQRAIAPSHVLYCKEFDYIG